MGRKLLFEEDGVTLKLTGATAFFALKSTLVMPYETIASVSVDHFVAPPWMLRMPGTSVSFLNLYEGSFSYQKEWYFLSYRNKVPFLILNLQGHRQYSYVVVELPDPTAAAADVRRRLRERSE